MAVYDANDNLIMRFNYADAGVPYSMEMNGTKYYFMYDQVGSLRAVVDNAGNIIKQIDYDSFGNVILDTDSSLKIPIGFAGGLYDSDTGLVRFGARDYDPSIGRWTAKDPIDFYGGDVNLYGYVGEGPVDYIDVLGLLSFSDALPNNWGQFIGGAVLTTGGMVMIYGGAVVVGAGSIAAAEGSIIGGVEGIKGMALGGSIIATGVEIVGKGQGEITGSYEEPKDRCKK